MQAMAERKSRTGGGHRLEGLLPAGRDASIR